METSLLCICLVSSWYLSSMGSFCASSIACQKMKVSMECILDECDVYECSCTVICMSVCFSQCIYHAHPWTDERSPALQEYVMTNLTFLPVSPFYLLSGSTPRPLYGCLFSAKRPSFSRHYASFSRNNIFLSLYIQLPSQRPRVLC